MYIYIKKKNDYFYLPFLLLFNMKKVKNFQSMTLLFFYKKVLIQFLLAL